MEAFLWSASRANILLDASFESTFATYVKPAYLYLAAYGFITLTLFIVIGIYRLAYLKKKKADFDESVKQKVEQWITEVLLNDSATELVIPDQFITLFKNPRARQTLIAELVREKGSFLGSVSQNLIKLYFHLGLNVDSRIKLDSKEPHIQCQGIHELCVMEQKDQVRKVYRFTNSPDNDVRIEAQTALIQWFGFSGLRFLDVVSVPITEFQQLKLLELLRPLPFTGLPRLAKWLTSENDTVVCFALKLAEHYKQVHVHKESAECLNHKNEAVRVQAVKTLVQIANPSTAGLLTKAYETERFTNRLNILKELPKVATGDQKQFLMVQLDQENEFLKLESAKVLAKCTTDGLDILEARSSLEPTPFKAIYLHVKSEKKR